MEASEKTVILHGETGTERDTEREREKKTKEEKKAILPVTTLPLIFF
jgi:hypothetical protein